MFSKDSPVRSISATALFTALSLPSWGKSQESLPPDRSSLQQEAERDLFIEVYDLLREGSNFDYSQSYEIWHKDLNAVLVFSGLTRICTLLDENPSLGVPVAKRLLVTLEDKTESAESITDNRGYIWGTIKALAETKCWQEEQYRTRQDDALCLQIIERLIKTEELPLSYKAHVISFGLKAGIDKLSPAKFHAFMSQVIEAGIENDQRSRTTVNKDLPLHLRVADDWSSEQQHHNLIITLPSISKLRVFVQRHPNYYPAMLGQYRYALQRELVDPEIKAGILRFMRYGARVFENHLNTADYSEKEQSSMRLLLEQSRNITSSYFDRSLKNLGEPEKSMYSFEASIILQELLKDMQQQLVENGVPDERPLLPLDRYPEFLPERKSEDQSSLFTADQKEILRPLSVLFANDNGAYIDIHEHLSRYNRGIEAYFQLSETVLSPTIQNALR